MVSYDVLIYYIMYFRAKNYRLTHNGQDKPEEEEVNTNEVAGVLHVVKFS